MFPRYRLGTLLGFPIWVNLSFILLLCVAPLWMGGAAGLLLALTVAGSVLLHELGHAVMARHLGVPIAGIELHFFGGAAQMAGMPRKPGDEIAVAAAGPAVSFALAGLGFGLGAVTALPFLVVFGWVNLVLAGFNLLPAFPSDGGRILRALLARRRGLVAATELAVKVGRVVCVALALIGLFQGAYQLILLAGVLWVMGGAERLATRLGGDRDGWRGDQDGDSAGPPRVEYIPPSARTDRWPTGTPRRVVFWFRP